MKAAGEERKKKTDKRGGMKRVPPARISTNSWTAKITYVSKQVLEVQKGSLKKKRERERCNTHSPLVVTNGHLLRPKTTTSALYG